MNMATKTDIFKRYLSEYLKADPPEGAKAGSNRNDYQRRRK